MPFSATRDLWLVLKARDEATRALRSFSTNIRDVGRQAQMAEAIAARADAQRLLRMQRAQGATKEQIAATQGLIDKYDAQAKALRVLDMRQEEHRRKMLILGQQMQSVSSVAATMGLTITAVGIGGLIATKKLVDASIEYNRQVKLTLTQTDGFKTSVEELAKIGTDVARRIAVPFEQIQTTMYDIFSSTNANVAQAKKLIEAFSKTAVAGQVDLQAASRGTMAILNAFHIPIEKVNDVLDIEFQLVRKGVGTYEEFAKVIGRVAPSANRAGQSLTTMSAMLVFLTRNGLSTAMAAASAARALDAFSNPKAVNQLEQMGIKMKDARGEFLPLVDILRQLESRLGKLAAPERAKIIANIFKGAGGTIQARRFIDQVLKPGQFEAFIGFLTDMQHSTGQFEAAYQKMANTTAAKTQLLSNRWNVLKVLAGDALIPIFTKVVDAMSKVFEWFNKLSPSQQKMVVTTLSLVTAFSAILGVILLVVSGLAALAAAITVAGSGFFIAIGAIAGFTAGIIALGAAIFIAWKKSETFRKAIIAIGNKVSDVYHNAIIPAFNALKPAIAGVSKVVVDRLLPAFKEIVNFVKMLFLKAFTAISNVIKTVVIPAFEYLAKFYEKHKVAIGQLVTGFIFFGKWALKISIVIGAILVAALGAFVIATALVVAAIIGVVMLIVKLIEWTKTLIHWFKVEIPKAWSATKDFFINIWNAIVGFFVDVWNRIVDIFKGFKDSFNKVWNAFWDSDIMQFLRSIINLIVSLVKLAFNFMLLAVETFIKLFMTGWRTLWNFVKSVALSFWNWAFPFFKFIWNTIVSVFNAIKNAVMSAWNWLWDNVIGKAIVGAKVIIDKIKSMWSTVFSHTKQILEGVWNFIRDKFNGIVDFVKGLGTKLFDAGANIIKSLINGIKSKIDEVTSTISSLADKIKSFLPFSPAKRGPFAGMGNPYYSGQAIATLLAKGMRSRMSMLTQTTSMLAGGLNTGMNSSILGMSGGGGSGTNQVFNIATQEIDPRRHAEELGFLISSRG